MKTKCGPIFGDDGSIKGTAMKDAASTLRTKAAAARQAVAAYLKARDAAPLWPVRAV